VYFTVTTVGTVGYGDIAPHTVLGRPGGAGDRRGWWAHLGVLGNLTDLFILRRGPRPRGEMNVQIGAFFSEVGRDLLVQFAKATPREGRCRWI